MGGRTNFVNARPSELVLIQEPAPDDDFEALPGSLPENDQGGVFMRLSVSDSDDSGNGGFQKIVNGFLLQPGLPFSTVLTAEKVNRIFRKHGGLFGENGIYSTAVVLWAFLGQVLRDGKEASCSFMMIAQLLNRRVDVCARLHHLRRADFRKGRRIGKYDHIIVWTRPSRPEWMDEATYATIPETLELRELRYAIVEKGKRTKSITVVNTLTDVGLFMRAA